MSAIAAVERAVRSAGSWEDCEVALLGMLASGQILDYQPPNGGYIEFIVDGVTRAQRVPARFGGAPHPPAPPPPKPEPRVEPPAPPQAAPAPAKKREFRTQFAVAVNGGLRSYRAHILELLAHARVKSPEAVADSWMESFDSGERK